MQGKEKIPKIPFILLTDMHILAVIAKSSLLFKLQLRQPLLCQTLSPNPPNPTQLVFSCRLTPAVYVLDAI